MTTTGPADVVMAACSNAVAGPLVPARPGFRELVSVWPASGEPTVVRPVFPGSASFKPAVDPMTGRSCTPQPDLLPAGPLRGVQAAAIGIPHPSGIAHQASGDQT